MNKNFLKNQILPIFLTVVTAAILVVLLFVEIHILNRFTASDIHLTIRWVDILIGLTIYLKTSIDFAIYIGNLMAQNPGWKSRIAIEIGTAIGNAAGTMIILLLWAFFKEIEWLLAIMIALAALVLFRLAQDGLSHAKTQDSRTPRWFQYMVNTFEKILQRINKIIAPILRFLVPHLSMRSEQSMSFWPLIGLAFTIPFILGLDDFAGYVPLFNVINVLGFGIGVFAGHMILNMMLYISPSHTIRAVKNPVISFLGSVAFVGLGIWGLVEVVKIFVH